MYIYLRDILVPGTRYDTQAALVFFFNCNKSTCIFFNVIM